MYREKELSYYFRDASVKVLVCMESLYGEMIRKVTKETGVEHVITTSELDFLDPISPPPFILKALFVLITSSFLVLHITFSTGRMFFYFFHSFPASAPIFWVRFVSPSL
jgi:hypothetical protein